MKTLFRRCWRVTCCGALVLLQGCATVSGGANVGTDPRDPWERWNRQVYGLNDAVDNAVLKPVATAYQKAVPSVVRRGVDNFFGNFGDAWSMVNNLLQGKVENGIRDMFRVTTNTLFGLGGLLDIATELRLDRQGEDFGQTLGYWGVGSGPYVVLPLLGPSTLRDTSALPLDTYVSPNLVVNDSAAKAGLTTLRVVNLRANLLGASRMLDDVALDKYNFTRDAYLQRRRNQVFDGNPPPEAEERYDLPEAEPKK
ncbi:MAG: VacJ family lipoprotein [Rhizobacter sp.]